MTTATTATTAPAARRQRQRGRGWAGVMGDSRFKNWLDRLLERFGLAGRQARRRNQK